MSHEEISSRKVGVEGVDSYFTEPHWNQRLLSHAQNGLVENVLD